MININDLTDSEFDNEPLDLDSLVQIPMNLKHNSLGFGQSNPGRFKKELLINNITDTFMACELGFRTGTSRRERYKENQYVLFTAKKYNYKLLAVITKSSYKVSSISKERWSNIEGWDISYFDLNPDVVNKYQFTFKIIDKIY